MKQIFLLLVFIWSCDDSAPLDAGVQYEPDVYRKPYGGFDAGQEPTPPEAPDAAPDPDPEPADPCDCGPNRYLAVTGCRPVWGPGLVAPIYASTSLEWDSWSDPDLFIRVDYRGTWSASLTVLDAHEAVYDDELWGFEFSPEGGNLVLSLYDEDTFGDSAEIVSCIFDPQAVADALLSGEASCHTPDWQSGAELWLAPVEDRDEACLP